MEHIKFNVKKNITANDLFDPLGSDINAFTTYKYTSYLVYGTKSFNDNLNNLLDYVYNPYFTKGMISKEKGIIASEINMGKDQPYSELHNIFNKCMYHNLKYKNLISGEIEDIKKVNVDNIQFIYNTFYHPKNMFLIVCGNVNQHEILKIVNDNLAKKKIEKYLNPEIIKQKEPKEVVCHEKEIKTHVEVDKAKIGFKIEKKNFKNYSDLELNILFNLILDVNFGETSTLREELLQEELITFLAANRFVLDDYVVIDITFESNYLDDAIDKIMDKMKHLNVTEEELTRKVHGMIATLITNYENVEQVNNMIQNYIIYYGELVPNLKNIYESITLKDVKEIIKHMSLEEKVVVKMIKDN